MPSEKNVPDESFLDPELPHLDFREKAQPLSPRPQRFLLDKETPRIYAETEEESLGEQTGLSSPLGQRAWERIHSLGESRGGGSRHVPLPRVLVRTTGQAFTLCSTRAPRGDRRHPTPQLILCQRREGLARKAVQGPGEPGAGGGGGGVLGGEGGVSAVLLRIKRWRPGLTRGKGARHL